jgi:hypothetical protein
MEAAQLFLEEKKFITASEKRRNFITNLISKAKKNSLVLFHLINHGEALYSDLVAKLGKKKVFYIDGQTKSDDREDIKKLMEQTFKHLLAKKVTKKTAKKLANFRFLIKVTI